MTRKISLYAVITALTVAVSMVFIIPVPATNGFVTLADAGIYIASLLFGPIGGLTVGALSLMISGYALATSWLYGVGAGIASLPGNIIQSLFGVIVALPLSQTLKRVLPKNGRLEERRMNK